jgi:hypothetical protein
VKNLFTKNKSRPKKHRTAEYTVVPPKFRYETHRHLKAYNGAYRFSLHRKSLHENYSEAKGKKLQSVIAHSQGDFLCNRNTEVSQLLQRIYIILYYYITAKIFLQYIFNIFLH